MKLVIEIEIPSITCIGCGNSAQMTVNAVVKDSSSGEATWKASISSRPPGWKAAPHDLNPTHGLCNACAVTWVPMAPPPPSRPAPSAAVEVSPPPPAVLPRGVVPAVAPVPYAAKPPIMVASSPKTTSIPPPAQSAVAKSVVPNMAPPMSARPMSVSNVQRAQAPVHVTSAKVEHVKQQAMVSPIPQLVPQAPPPAPPPAIMSKATAIPAPSAPVPASETVCGDWAKPTNENGIGR